MESGRRRIYLHELAEIADGLRVDPLDLVRRAMRRDR
jgi:hypothetical protein